MLVLIIPRPDGQACGSRPCTPCSIRPSWRRFRRSPRAASCRSLRQGRIIPLMRVHYHLCLRSHVRAGILLRRWTGHRSIATGPVARPVCPGDRQALVVAQRPQGSSWSGSPRGPPRTSGIGWKSIVMGISARAEQPLPVGVHTVRPRRQSRVPTTRRAALSVSLPRCSRMPRRNRAAGPPQGRSRPRLWPFPGTRIPAPRRRSRAGGRELRRASVSPRRSVAVGPADGVRTGPPATR